MIKYFRYVYYVLRHKYYVAIECLRRGLFLQAITHDLSKFRLSEIRSYAEYFYGNSSGGVKKGDHEGTPIQEAFDLSWLKHQHRNPHHWQHWILQEDSGGVKIMEMPDKYMKEMVCDWIGCGKALGFPDTKGWYEKNKDQMRLHVNTRTKVENLLNQL